MNHDDDVEMQQCSTCHHLVPTANFDMHVVTCERRRRRRHPSASSNEQEKQAENHFRKIKSQRNTDPSTDLPMGNAYGSSTENGAGDSPDTSSPTTMVECSKCARRIPKVEKVDHAMAHRLEESYQEEDNLAQRRYNVPQSLMDESLNEHPSQLPMSSNSMGSEEGQERDLPVNQNRRFQFSLGPSEMFFSNLSSGFPGHCLADIRDWVFQIANDQRMSHFPRDFSSVPSPLNSILPHLIDCGEADYEMLLRLSEMQSPPRGVDASIMEALPVGSHENNKTNELSEDSKQCLICLEDFKKGDKQRWLPCMHTFHLKCVDKWLATSTQCPICKIDIEEAASRGSSRRG